jgi:hypothetical protein
MLNTVINAVKGKTDREKPTGKNRQQAHESLCVGRCRMYNIFDISTKSRTG